MIKYSIRYREKRTEKKIQKKNHPWEFKKTTGKAKSMFVNGNIYIKIMEIKCRIRAKVRLRI